MKFKAIFKKDMSSEDVVVGLYNDKPTAIENLVKYGERHASYCLDSREDRISALEARDFCMCGCGPSELLIRPIAE